MKLLKNHKLKVIFLLALVMIGGIFLSIDTKAAVTAPESFTGNSEKLLTGYIAGVKYAKLTNDLGDYVYCRNIKLDIPYGVKMTYEGEAPAGLAYILSNGYPRKSITGDSDKDYYITQAAVWWYIDNNMGGNNLSTKFKSTGSDSYDLRKYVIELVEGAQKVTSYATPGIVINNQDNVLNLSNDKKYYESNAITISSLYTTGNYTVTLENAPEGTKVVNATSFATQTSFNDNETFKVVVPAENLDTASVDIKINVTATGSINKAYMYKSTNPEKQDVVSGRLYPETSVVTATSNVVLETSKVTVTKIDEKTNEPLSGATFVLTDSEGKEITTWTSTTNSHIIRNLPNGTYFLKETKAPEGYILNENTVKFTISDTNRNIAIRVKNKEEAKKATIIKIDATTKNKIAGATLVVKNSNGEEIAKFKTTTEPYVLNNLENGKYTVEELEAPKGYAKTDEVYTFTIDSNNKDVTVTIENKAIDKLVTITKIDAATKKPLYGATLVIKDSEGNVVEEFVTTEEGYTITGLKDGEYTVEELVAPAGYKKSDEIYRFTISDETPTAFVFFENNEEVIVPFTGSNKSLITTLFGGLLLISGVGFVYYNGKKQKA